MKKISTILACSLPLLASAHTGEGAHTHTDGGFTIFHYFTAREHAVITWPMILIATVALFVYYRNKRVTSSKRPADNA